MRTKGGLVAAVGVLLRPGRSLSRRVALHDLNGQVAIARKDKQPGGVGLVNSPVWTWRFERDQPPRSDKPCPDALISTAVLTDRDHRRRHPGNQSHYASRHQFFHIGLGQSL